MKMIYVALTLIAISANANAGEPGARFYKSVRLEHPGITHLSQTIQSSIGSYEVELSLACGTQNQQQQQDGSYYRNLEYGKINFAENQAMIINGVIYTCNP